MARKNIEDFVKSRPPFFWWMLANILAISFAISAWIVCLNLFRDPTHPTSYKWMMKVGRIQPLEQFDPTTAPRPKATAGPLALEAQFQAYQPEDLSALNHELKRAYLTNYKKSKFLTYAKGNFKITEVRALTESDFLTDGVVVRAQAMVKSDSLKEALAYPVFIECLFPSADDASPLFSPGDSLILKQIPDCAAILHIDSLEYEGDRALYLTVVPLCAIEYATPAGQKIHISPPEMANVGAPFPVF